MSNSPQLYPEVIAFLETYCENLPEDFMEKWSEYAAIDLPDISPLDALDAIAYQAEGWVAQLASLTYMSLLTDTIRNSDRQG